MKKYEAYFTLEGGAEIEADSEKEALELAQKEAERQFGALVAFEMRIEVYELEN